MVSKPVKFHHHPSVVYPTNILKDVYQYLISMCCWLHGCKNTEVFEENWIYMFNMVVTRGKILNWEDILSFELQHHVGQEKSYLRANQAL